MWSKLQEVFDELETDYRISYSRQGSYEIDEELLKVFLLFGTKVLNLKIITITDLLAVTGTGMYSSIPRTQLRFTKV